MAVRFQLAGRFRDALYGDCCTTVLTVIFPCGTLVLGPTPAVGCRRTCSGDEKVLHHAAMIHHTSPCHLGLDWDPDRHDRVDGNYNDHGNHNTRDCPETIANFRWYTPAYTYLSVLSSQTLPKSN